MFVFFFKQKTAYEMRISDWSSDVCSSDLLQLWSDLANGNECAALRVMELLVKADAVSPVFSAMRATVLGLNMAGLAPLIAEIPKGRSEERRVGKSVSVRVDPGGRRIIKKKTNKKMNYLTARQLSINAINKKH